MFNFFARRRVCLPSLIVTFTLWLLHSLFFPFLYDPFQVGRGDSFTTAAKFIRTPVGLKDFPFVAHPSIDKMYVANRMDTYPAIFVRMWFYNYIVSIIYATNILIAIAISESLRNNHQFPIRIAIWTYHFISIITIRKNHFVVLGKQHQGYLDAQRFL